PLAVKVLAWIYGLIGIAAGCAATLVEADFLCLLVPLIMGGLICPALLARRTLSPRLTMICLTVLFAPGSLVGTLIVFSPSHVGTVGLILALLVPLTLWIGTIVILSREDIVAWFQPPRPYSHAAWYAAQLEEVTSEEEAGAEEEPERTCLSSS